MRLIYLVYVSNDLTRVLRHYVVGAEVLSDAVTTEIGNHVNLVLLEAHLVEEGTDAKLSNNLN